jgi:hypothetical protein
MQSKNILPKTNLPIPLKKTLHYRGYTVSIYSINQCKPAERGNFTKISIPIVLQG